MRLAVEDAPDVVEGVDEAIDVVLDVVDGDAGAAAGEILDLKPGEQRLGRVVACADAHTVHVHHAGDVVRAVSYTHLDVYKRQLQTWLRESMKRSMSYLSL